MTKQLGWASMAGVALVVTVSLVAAQDRRDGQDAKGKQRPERQSTEQPNQPRGGRAQGDTQLVTWLASENEGEIALAKFAAERAQNEQVKKFAEQLVQDHTEFLSKLRRVSSIASTSGSDTAITRDSGRTATDKPRSDDPAQTQPRTDTAQKRSEGETLRRGYLDPDGRADLLKIKQEIDKQCVETAKKELGEKSGAEFDKCFVGLQIMAHLAMADTLKVMKNYASPELGRILDDGEKATNDHLKQAKDLMKQVEGDTPKRSSNKTDQ